MDNIQYLSQFNLLRSLSIPDLIEMEQLTSITVIPKYTFIQTPATFAEGLYFIKKGKVRLYKVNVEGKQFTLDILSEGNVFGEMAGISLGTRDMYIETVEESHICLMDKTRFESFLIHHPQFMMNLIQVLSERLVSMSHLAQHLALGNLQDKILYVIDKLSSQCGVVRDKDYDLINLPITHQELAHLVGATREAVSAVLRELAEQEIIKTGFKSISIHREKRIERAANWSF
ncbi:Crp/Fnr family transcriptional regulator [Paenibacillus sp. UMB4589-SE434]|uniref:Crp/Fnr family transcriptional regulator n=1 Tax=Paenibacillus sp. UMB4589-SE434 TaxID=3046314 RepID=UPI002550F7BD|nr:Crp/Fnr family transcriptional regulator [Paenibacillus sp. UMB4589-SE434]MDK8182392.1 Crp/Fnr family transcriptional regulator [Paenibacillus sp. UMB4589-SE434]